jgi:peptidoglycan/LPS O-acetylase OafA/YrhL
VRSRALPLVADLVAVLVFVLIGRGSHAEGTTVAGTVATAWPFLTGAAVGEVVVVAARRAPRSPAAGAIVVGATVGVGMLLRRVAGDGTAVSFVVVATTFLTLAMVGWRVVLHRRRRSARAGA